MLPQQKALANVIITPLDQPHRFDFALQCKCGFQSHGYKNEDKSVSGGDAAALAKDAARQHLIQRHGAKPSELPDIIRVTPFTTVGGMTWDQLDLRVKQWLEKHPDVPLVETRELSEKEIQETFEADKKNPTQEEKEKKETKAPAAQPAPAKTPDVLAKGPALPPQGAVVSTPPTPVAPAPPAKPILVPPAKQGEVQTGGDKK